MDAEEYIHYQSLVKRSLKLIVSITNWRDSLDLKTCLRLANTLAVRQIIEGKTFHLHHLFLTPQDWQLCEENLVPSWDFFDKKIYNASVHLNQTGEIYPD